MAIAFTNTLNKINDKIALACQNPIDAARLTAIVSTDLTNLYKSVQSVGDLPSASESKGRLIYVVDESGYLFSDGTRWTKDFSSNYIATETQAYFWGGNNNFQLGDGTINNKCSPIRDIECSPNWCDISVREFSAAIKSGQLWLWGSNTYSRLGDGTTISKCSPVREASCSTNWCRVSVGKFHTAAIKETGQIWSWGYGSYGRLGNGRVGIRNSPVREISSANNWCSVVAGNSHTAAINKEGRIFTWGESLCGVLGTNNLIDTCSPVREITSSFDWCRISSGLCHLISIKTSGRLWSWGNNSNGRLGDGTTTDKCSPVREICSATDWCNVGAGGYHSVAIKTDGSMWSWGTNLYGQLGDGTTVNKCSPIREFCSATNWCDVSSGKFHTVASNTITALWAWGLNSEGRLGDGTTTNRCSPVREVCSLSDWCLISAGDHTAGLRIVNSRGFLET